MIRCNCFQHGIWLIVLVSCNGDIDSSRNSCSRGKRGGERNMNVRCVSYAGGRLPEPRSVNQSWPLFYILVVMDLSRCVFNDILLFVVQSTAVTFKKKLIALALRYFRDHSSPSQYAHFCQSNWTACEKVLIVLWLATAIISHEHPTQVTVSDTMMRSHHSMRTAHTFFIRCIIFTLLLYFLIKVMEIQMYPLNIDSIRCQMVICFLHTDANVAPN